MAKIKKVFYRAPSKKLSNSLNLTFDKKHGYCISDAYVNDKGENIKPLIKLGLNVYGLKYFDGCFNPYLVQYKN